MPKKKVTNRTLNEFPVALWDDVIKVCKKKFPEIKIKFIIIDIFTEWVKRNR